MNRFRILLLSSTRPWRAWRIAERISSEIPDAEICGVVQHAVRQLPRTQRLIAAGRIDRIGLRDHVLALASLWSRKVLGELVHLVLWCAHGCPRGIHAKGNFTVIELAQRCRRDGRPFLHADHCSDQNVADFVRRQNPDLVIVLGQPSLGRVLLEVPANGLVRVMTNRTTETLQQGIELKVEHFARGSESPCTLVSLTLPSQTHSGALGVTLKNDLIADDLLVQVAKSSGEGSQTQASKEVREWAQRMLSPYLNQFELPSQHFPAAPERITFRRRYRSVVKLCVQSLLGFPWVMGRNWYRRLRGRYPVLILTHHLVSDRPHPMGIPTEEFWLRIRFLQRHYRIVSLSEAAALLRSGRVSVPTVVLTFDDGYCDNFISLRAVAEEMGAPVALFIATQPVETHQEFDHDLSVETRGFFPLTWGQIRYWSVRGAEFGSHTRTHFDCGAARRSGLEQELVGSKSDLEVRLGRRANFFAFPFGKHENISSEAMQIAASTYSIFLSSFGGENLPQKGTGRQHLLRKGFYSDPWELELEIQSVFDLVQRSKLRLKRPLSGWRPDPATAKS